MSNWFSFAHFHVTALLACMAFVSRGDTKLEVTLGYTIASIINIYLAIGVFSIDVLSAPIAAVETIIFLFFLLQIAFFTNQLEKGQPLIPLPRKLTSRSFDRRKVISVSTVAVAAQFVSAVFRVVEMTFGDGKNGYTGDMSSPVYQNISSMAICDMMIAAFLLAAALRFYDPNQLKIVLYGQLLSMLLSQVMLSGGQGELISSDQARSGAIGTFVSILVALVGAL
jgi:magnesium-transporting ATPase (P-type)